MGAPKNKIYSIGDNLKSNSERNNMLPQQDDYLVWERFIKGDNNSLIYIYNRYADVLFGYGKQFTKDLDLIKDCIQILFCDLIRQRSNLSKVKSIKAYLFVSFKRRILKELKKAKKYQLEEEGFTFDFEDQSISISRELQEEDILIIRDKLNSLPINQREAIYLYFYEGLGYKEIASILDIKVHSARILTYRALGNLESELKSLLSSFYSILLYLSFYSTLK